MADELIKQVAEYLKVEPRVQKTADDADLMDELLETVEYAEDRPIDPDWEPVDTDDD